MKRFLGVDMKPTNELNEFFTCILTTENIGQAFESVLIFSGREGNQNIEQIEVTRKDMLGHLERLYYNKLPGSIGISPILLFFKVSVKLLILRLKIWNLSLQPGLVPEDWKVASVTPILKRDTGKIWKITSQSA